MDALITKYHIYPVVATAVAYATLSYVFRTFFWKDFSKFDDSKVPLNKKDWKKDVVYVYGFPKMRGVQTSPFVFKLLAFLEYTGIPYEVIKGQHMGKNPKGKLPMVELNGHVITDSTHIIAQLSSHFGKYIDSDLTKEQAATSLAITRLVEDHLNFTMVYFRWQCPKGWPSFREALPIPGFIKLLLAPTIRAGVAEQLWQQGMSRNTKEQVFQFAKDDLQACSDLLGEHKFFFGKTKPHIVDLVLYAHLGCQSLPINNEHYKLITTGFPNLVAFKERMEMLIPVNNKQK